jgi:hypothetical protein
LPVAARVIVDGESEVDVEFLAEAPLRVNSSTLARALTRCSIDGLDGVGWASWLTP